MAKREAECTCKTCGKTFYRTVDGYNSRDAESKMKWAESFFDECTDCWKKRQEDELKEKAEQAISEELPELNGTEKQVKWANGLRDKWIVSMKDKFDDIRRRWTKKRWRDESEKELFNVALEVVEPHLADFVKAKTSARWWIDSRYDEKETSIKEIEQWVMTEMKTEEEKQAEAEAEAERRAMDEEMTVRPERLNFDGIVNLSVDEENRVIRAEYGKDDAFREIVKDLGYRWREYAWKKSFIALDSLTDREGELGNRLLADGFAVRFATAEGKDKAISGEFSDEVVRFVYLIDDQFKLYWEYGNDRMYREAKSLRTAKWDSGKGRMSVKRSAFAEVEDFAEINGFVLSEKAKQAVKEERAKLDGATVVSVKRKESKSEESDKLQEILESSREVIADLVDED